MYIYIHIYSRTFSTSAAATSDANLREIISMKAENSMNVKENNLMVKITDLSPPPPQFYCCSKEQNSFDAEEINKKILGTKWESFENVCTKITEWVFQSVCRHVARQISS